MLEGLLPYMHLFNKYFSILSIILNIVLIYLIATKSPKQFGVYKYLMMLISIFEIFYSGLDALLVPVHYSYRSGVVVLISTSDKLFSRPILLILNGFYWGCFGFSLAMFGIHFIYRYLAVSENPLLQTFQSWKITLWLLIPFSIGLTWVLTGIYLCGPTNEYTEFLRIPVKNTFHENIEEYEYLGAFLYYKNENNGSYVPNWKPITGMMIMSFTVMITFAIIVFCGIKDYLRIKCLMKYTSTTSSKSNNLQSQLFYALLLQTSIPFLLLHIPVTLEFMFAIFDSGMGTYCFITSMTIVLYPAIDPFPNFIIITPYRKAIYGVFKKRERRSQVTITTNKYFETH